MRITVTILTPRNISLHALTRTHANTRESERERLSERDAERDREREREESERGTERMTGDAEMQRSGGAAARWSINRLARLFDRLADSLDYSID